MRTLLPPRLQVELTNACPLACDSCARNYWDEASNGDAHMSEATLASLGPLFANAMEVTYGGYGDPTISPLLNQAVRRAKEAGAAVRVITGGAALNSRQIQDLCDAGLDRLVLSMDGARDETLRSLRGVPLSAYLGWLRGVRAARAPDTFRPLLQLNFVAQRDNIRELPELVQLCDREGVAGIDVVHINVYDGSTGEKSLLADPGAAEPWLEQARRDAERLGVFLHLPALGGEASSCRQPFEHLFIRYDGRVRGCCSAAFEPGHYGLEVGDLSLSPEQLWSAPILQRFRAASELGRDEDLPTPCQSCSFRLPTLEAHLRPLKHRPTRIGEHRARP